MHHSAAPDHALHDTTLIAAHAAGDSSTTDTAAAALLASCSTCAALHRDLLAISAATRALPQTARAPRDFRLSPAQARRLQRGSWLRSLVRPFAGSRAASNVLALTFTSAGLAGLLVAAFAPALLGGAASAPSRDMNATGQQGAGAPAAPEFAVGTSGPAGPAAAPTDAAVKVDNAGGSGEPPMEVAVGAASPPTANGGAGAGSGGGAGAGGGAGSDGRTAANGPATALAMSAPSPIVIGSIGLLAVGLALFGLRFAARRLR